MRDTRRIGPWLLSDDIWYEDNVVRLCIIAYWLSPCGYKPQSRSQLAGLANLTTDDVDDMTEENWEKISKHTGF